MEETRLNIRPRPGGTHAIVIAAGQPELRFLWACTLKDDRYELHEEATEEDAFTQTYISRPALVILDTDLMKGDGIECCRRIKENSLTRETAVLVMSTHADRRTRDRVAAAGADAFMAKPFSPRELLDLAVDLCGRASGQQRFGMGRTFGRAGFSASA